jgi:hypothetical protein
MVTLAVESRVLTHGNLALMISGARKDYPDDRKQLQYQDLRHLE